MPAGFRATDRGLRRSDHRPADARLPPAGDRRPALRCRGRRRQGAGTSAAPAPLRLTSGWSRAAKGPCYACPAGPLCRLLLSPDRPGDAPPMTAVRPERVARAHARPPTSAEPGPALHQPRAVLAGLQRARPARGQRRAQPAPRAGQVPGDLRRRTSTSSSRSGWPACASRSPHRRSAARPTAGRPAEQLARDPATRSRRWSRSRARSFARIRAQLAEADIRIVDYAAVPEHHARAARAVPRGGLPGPDAAGRRPGPSVPVHLDPQPVARGRPARPGDRRAALRPGQGAAGPAPPGGASTRRTFVLLDQVIAEQPRHPVHRAWRSSRPTSSGSPATPTWRSRRTRRTTC